MSKLLENLNKEQKRAVTHESGPLLVVAGAGTGKTTVITRRIAWLITEKKVAPSEILALTFTDKAAGEMEQRVDKLVPYGYVDTWISTFHAFGDRILREHALEIGLSPNFKVLTQSEQAVFLAQRIFNLEIDALRPLSNPNKYITSIVEHISHLKDEMITPEQYLDFAQNAQNNAKTDEEMALAKQYIELAKVYANYNAWMSEADQIDFGDQILLAIELFKNNPHILKQYQNQFKYCLVDEFQDTNVAQNELLKLLFGRAAPRQNITAVGDDDQSIYAFRGAAVQNIIDFQNSWKNCKTIVLNNNYRSTQPILDVAYSLIQHNNPDRLEEKASINKKLKGRSGGVAPEFNLFDDDYTEAKSIAEKIVSYTKNDDSFSDIAVLVRANSQLDPIIHEFRSRGIPYIAPGSSGLYDEPIIRLILSFIRTLANYDDHLSLYYLATSDVYNVDAKTMTAVSSYIRYNNMHFRNALENIEKYPELIKRVGDDKEKIVRFTKEIDSYISYARGHNVGEVIYKWLDKTGLLKNTIKKSENDVLAQVELENIAAFYEKIKDFVRAADNTGVTNFVDNLKLLIEAGENPALSQTEIDVNAVTLLTVHSAKGLEWPVVFLPSISSDRFPARHRRDTLPIPETLTSSKIATKDTHVQEERRLFYVAATRAKDNLFISVAKRYDRGVREKKISPFVFEALGTNIKQNAIAKRTDTVEKLSLFDVDNHKLQPLPKKFFRTDSISLTPHQIDDYITCPKKFEYIHIIEVPLSASWHVGYGNVLHNAIAYYFTQKLKGDKPALDEITQIYNNGWSSEGFVSLEQEKRKRAIGEKALIEFYEREEKENRDIQSIEQSFEFKIDGVTIRGRYDCVVNKINKIIIDFKSSDVSEEKDAEKRVKDSTQLQIYTISEETITGKRPKTALYFVESGLIHERLFTDKELNKTREKIKQAVEGLRKQDFKATPGYNQCRWCAYKDICPYKAKGS